MSLPWKRCDVTADEWAAEGYRQQRHKGCGRSPIVVLALTFAMLLRKGLRRWRR
jgi:hypothetical protein